MNRLFWLALTICLMTMGAASAQPAASAEFYYEASAVWSSRMPGPNRMFDVYWAYGAQRLTDDGELIQSGGVGHTHCFSRDLFLIHFFCRPGGRIKKLPAGAFAVDPALGSASLTVEGSGSTSTVEWVATDTPTNFHWGGSMWGAIFVSNSTSRAADATGSILDVDPVSSTDSMSARLSLNIGANVYR